MLDTTPHQPPGEGEGGRGGTGRAVEGGSEVRTYVPVGVENRRKVGFVVGANPQPYIMGGGGNCKAHCARSRLQK